MRIARTAVGSLVVVALLAGAALADWDEGAPAKWVQLPDETPLGVDVNATLHPEAPAGGIWLLADDFECKKTEYITDIHIWGSWFNDRLPQIPGTADNGDPTAVKFTLSIWTDIPAVPGQLHSMPGEKLREYVFEAGDFQARVWKEVPDGEGWFHPNGQTPYVYPADQIIWQYNFDLRDPFLQVGTPEQPVVYWLALQAEPLYQGDEPDDWTHFGWKSSIEHWNDDAVWGDDPQDQPPWRELIYPFGHEYETQSIDLAFVIVPEPATLMVLALGLISASMLRRSRS